MTATEFTETSACDPRIARSRAKMLAAATELLVESGARAVTVDAVAERSGVAKSTLYRHWSARTALLVDVVHSNMPQLVEPDLTSGFEASLRQVIHQFADHFGDPEWARIIPALLALKHQIPEIDELAHSDQSEKVNVLQTVLDLGVEEGALPDGLVLNQVAALLIGPLLLNCVSGDPASTHATADFVVDRLIASYR